MDNLDKGSKGRIVFLNGVTSSGKTSIAKALQERGDIFFYALSSDLFQSMIGRKRLIESYWGYLSGAIIMMYHTAKLFSDMGHNVLIDGLLLERPEMQPHYQQLKEILKDSRLDIVYVYCPLEVCRQRNIRRADRHETQSLEQASIMAKDILYSCTVETHKNTPEECAEKIMACLLAESL